MTTATPRHRTTRAGATWLWPTVSTAVAGLLLMAAAGLATGSAGAAGAALGTVIVCVFFTFGAVVLGLTMRHAPAASLLVALLTYTLKVVLLAVVFVGLTRSQALEGPVDAGWLAGTLVMCTVVWLTSQVVASVRARQPVYDLPSDGKEASVR